MVISKGSSYGEEAHADPQRPVCDDDVALANHIERHGLQQCTVTAGDILRTLGGGAPSGVAAQAYPVDVLDVQADGERFVASAHVVARHRLWRGTFLAAMNAAYVEGLYLGPRSHPNDGLVDVTTGSLRWQQRIMARRRAETGTHLPHPDMKMVRRPKYEITFDQPMPLYIDGVAVGRFGWLAIEVRPDAGVVVV